MRTVEDLCGCEVKVMGWEKEKQRFKFSKSYEFSLSRFWTPWFVLIDNVYFEKSLCDYYFQKVFKNCSQNLKW